MGIKHITIPSITLRMESMVTHLLFSYAYMLSAGHYSHH